MPETGAAIGVIYMIKKGMVRESIRKMTNGKTTGTSGLVSEMVKLGGERRERKLEGTEINRLLMICLMSHLLVYMGGLQVNVEKAKMMISSEEA